VTLRDRDSLQQERIPLDTVVDTVHAKLRG